MTNRRLAARASGALVARERSLLEHGRADRARPAHPLGASGPGDWRSCAARAGERQAARRALQRAGRGDARDARASPHRARVVEAIVALQVLYDYLDVLSEQPTADPLMTSAGLFAALSDAVSVPADGSEQLFRQLPQNNDGGYLARLVVPVDLALARLPGAAAITAVTQGAAERCAEAQILHHAASRSRSPLGIAEPAGLGHSANRRARALDGRSSSPASTASVLAIHALIAAAADPAHDLQGRRRRSTRSTSRSAR